MSQKAITSIAGRGVTVRGNDIDTDRIIPARFLKCVVFDELGPHAFADDRKSIQEKGEKHPFDQEVFQGASILFVNKNFGCGSSREHAPQSLMRWGIQAVVGESFAEIFYGNCVSLGIPCVTLSEAEIEKAMAANEAEPDKEWTLDIEEESLNGPISIPVSINGGSKQQFLNGTWNPMDGLLAEMDKVQEVAKMLPYVD
jgi:3-isopropylmalate/(R)-2-methylmalate dehydratase small subunit